MEIARASLCEIKTYWETSAQTATDLDGLKPTARDPYLQAAVEDAIVPRIPKGARLYDFGCGEGSSTARFASRCSKTVGFDYIPAYVEAARAAHKNIEFYEANVTSLHPIFDRFGLADVAVTIRCLINLPTWELQKRGIDEVAQTIRKGGLYLLSEGWLEGWNGLNVLRKKAKLPPIELVSYNRLIERRAFEEHITPLFEIVEYVNLGFYIFMSRVLQPAFVAPGKPSHTHRINQIAQELLAAGIGADQFGDVDYAGIYVLRRR
jgi:SAM-dependent methyltransferase